MERHHVHGLEELMTKAIYRLNTTIIKILICVCVCVCVYNFFAKIMEKPVPKYIQSHKGFDWIKPSLKRRTFEELTLKFQNLLENYDSLKSVVWA